MKLLSQDLHCDSTLIVISQRFLCDNSKSYIKVHCQNRVAHTAKQMITMTENITLMINSMQHKNCDVEISAKQSVLFDRRMGNRSKYVHIIVS